MKVLHIYKDFYPPVIGGIEKHLNCLSQGLQKEGVDINILVSNTTAQTKIEDYGNIHIIKALEAGRLISAPLNPTLPFLMRKYGKDADLLHFHLPNPTSVIAYLLSGIKSPFVATYHSDIVRQVVANTIYRPLQRRFLKKAEAIIATSPNYIKTSSTLSRFENKCRVIPIGIDIDSYKNVNHNDVMSIKSRFGEKLILFVGKFRYYKGIEVLVDAMKNIDGTLVVIGNGGDKKGILKNIKNKGMGNKVVILGEISDTELKLYLNACDLLVLPSTYRSEAFGIVTIEAMACGKPIITTELGTGTSFTNIHSDTGIVVPPNDIEQLSRAINKLIHNPKLLRSYGEAAKLRAKNIFCSKLMTKTMIELYSSIMKKNRVTHTQYCPVKIR